MSAEDYGYASYDEMLNHAEHNGGGIDMDANAVEWVVSELAALRARVAELEAAQAVLTPRPCVTCQSAAEQMRDAAANVAESREKRYKSHPLFPAYGLDGMACEAHDISVAIRSLPLPSCGDCNPLAPSKPQSQAALSDQLRELVKLANANGLYDAADYIWRED